MYTILSDVSIEKPKIGNLDPCKKALSRRNRFYILGKMKEETNSSTIDYCDDVDSYMFALSEGVAFEIITP